MSNDFVVADFAEAWLDKFPRIELRGLGPRLVAALVGMSGSPGDLDDLDDLDEILAALAQLVVMLKASPSGAINPSLLFGALKGNSGLS
jgi:hypothetical protein